MPEELRVDAMELCVTACEKFSSNNEVLPKIGLVIAYCKVCRFRSYNLLWLVPVGQLPIAVTSG